MTSYKQNSSSLLLLSHFSRVWLCATPQMAAHQAPPFLGFSRQEHWSGLPFSSPMHESEKWKWSHSVVSVQLLATPWTAANQASLSMGFSRQSGLPLPSPMFPLWLAIMFIFCFFSGWLLIVKTDKHLLLLLLCNYYSLNIIVSWLVNRKTIELYFTKTRIEWKNL